MFHVSLLEQDSTKKGRVNEQVPELDAGDENSKEYEVEAIWDSVGYTNKLESGYLSGFYYLVAWKSYPEKKNTWKPLSAVQHLKKLISSFHKDYPQKSIATSPLINSAPPMARATVKPTTNRNQSRPVNSTSKQAKNCMELAYVLVKSFLLKTLSRIARIPYKSCFRPF